jgi:hypothetical protein
MKNIKNTMIILGVLAGIGFTSINAIAGDKPKNNKTEKEITTTTFAFDKAELMELERSLIEKYLEVNYQEEIIDHMVKIYYPDGRLFFEGEECIIENCLDEFEFMFENDMVKYYLIVDAHE